MYKYLVILLFIPFWTFAQLKHRTEIILLMGSRFEITPYAETDSLVNEAIKTAINEVKNTEMIMSEWIPESEISTINKFAGVNPIKVSNELYGIIKRSKKVSELTDGAFDISWAAARNIWHFDRHSCIIPNKEILDSVATLINYKNIILNDSDNSVFLKNPGMAIGLGAIAKGYVANKVRNVLLEMGIKNGIIIAGGDLITWGSPSESKNWPIGIANPDKSNEAIAWLEVGEMAVVTSGDYERYVLIDGKRYGHILNPKTCFPVTGLRSVTIICPDAEIADALATSVYVLGKEKGLALINQMKGIDCLLIDDEGKFHTSKNLTINHYNNSENKNKHTITIGN